MSSSDRRTTPTQRDPDFVDAEAAMRRAARRARQQAEEAARAIAASRQSAHDSGEPCEVDASRDR